MRALLMSGGLDSAALAHWLRPDVCLTIDYGQIAARGEMAASIALCTAMHLDHRRMGVDLSSLGTGDMAGRPTAPGAAATEFWPYRNQMLITLAAMMLMPEGVKEIMVGAVSTDRHADGKAPFFHAVNHLLLLQEGGVRVTAPALHLTTPSLLRRSAFPYDLIGLTFSCHVHEFACGQCAGCLKHRECVDDVYPRTSEQAV